MKTENGCSPEQHYLIHRARSERWERDRNRDKGIQFTPRHRAGTLTATVEAIAAGVFWVGVVALGMALLRTLPV